MTHPRQTIREAVAATLFLKTAAESRVFRTRKLTWRPVELPGLAVYSLEEAVDDELNRDAVRVLTLAIEAVTQAEPVDDALDAFCLEVETAMAADPTFGGEAVDSSLAATVIQVSEDQGRPVGSAQLTFTVRYYAQGSDLNEE